MNIPYGLKIQLAYIIYEYMEVQIVNILFFLTPKSEVAYIYEDYTMRQALEKMEYHRYSSIPIINKDGKYVGTITEGDLLWTLKNEFSLDF